MELYIILPTLENLNVGIENINYEISFVSNKDGSVFSPALNSKILLYNTQMGQSLINPDMVLTFS